MQEVVALISQMPQLPSPENIDRILHSYPFCGRVGGPGFPEIRDFYQNTPRYDVAWTALKIIGAHLQLDSKEKPRVDKLVRLAEEYTKGLQNLKKSRETEQIKKLQEMTIKLLKGILGADKFEKIQVSYTGYFLKLLLFEMDRSPRQRQNSTHLKCIALYANLGSALKKAPQTMHFKIQSQGLKALQSLMGSQILEYLWRRALFLFMYLKEKDVKRRKAAGRTRSAAGSMMHNMQQQQQQQHMMGGYAAAAHKPPYPHGALYPGGTNPGGYYGQVPPGQMPEEVAAAGVGGGGGKGQGKGKKRKMDNSQASEDKGADTKKPRKGKGGKGKGAAASKKAGEGNGKSPSKEGGDSGKTPLTQEEKEKIKAEKEKEKERAKAERERIRAEEREKAKVEREKAREKAKAEREKARAEEREKARLEREKVKAEEREKARLEREKLKAERDREKAREKAEKEKAKEKAAKEKAAKEVRESVPKVPERSPLDKYVGSGSSIFTVAMKKKIVSEALEGYGLDIEPATFDVLSEAVELHLSNLVAKAMDVMTFRTIPFVKSSAVRTTSDPRKDVAAIYRREYASSKAKQDAERAALLKEAGSKKKASRKDMDDTTKEKLEKLREEEDKKRLAQEANMATMSVLGGADAKWAKWSSNASQSQQGGGTQAGGGATTTTTKKSTPTKKAKKAPNLTQTSSLLNLLKSSGGSLESKFITLDDLLLVLRRDWRYKGSKWLLQLENA